MKNISLAIFIAVIATVGASFVFRTQSPSGVFTLYKDSSVVKSSRIYVGTFDSSDGPKHNSESCGVVLALLQKQPGVKTTFWCEADRYDADAHARSLGRS